MKLKRCIGYCVWMLVLMMLLCACSGNSNTAAVPVETAVPGTSAAGSQSDETTAPLRSIADVYEQTQDEHIFRLDAIDTDGFYVESAYLHDGYILLLMRDCSGQGSDAEQLLLDSGKMVLFPVLQPDAAVSLEVEGFAGRYILLDGGTVLASDWEGNYTVFDSELNEVTKVETNCSAFLGASETGDLWYLSEDSSFVLYRDGTQIQSIPAEGMSHGAYVGTRDGKAYFSMYNRYYGWTYAAIDTQTWTCEEFRLLCDSYEASNGLLCYSSEDKWYFTDIDDPYTVTAFTKPYSNESMWAADDTYLIGRIYDLDASRGTYCQDFRIYDMRSGGICVEKNNSELSEYEVLMQDYDQGIVLYETHDENPETKGLYLWDISGYTASEPAKAYDTFDYHVDEDRIAQLVQEIEELYGVIVYYDEAHLEEYTSGYDLVPCTESDLLFYTLVKLEECMAEYPDGFFEELKGETFQNIVYCLCSAHEQSSIVVPTDAAATVAHFTDALRMSIDVHYWYGLRQIFLHENMHMMDSRIGEEMQKISDRTYVEYWYNVLSSPEYPSMQNYNWEQTEENLEGTYEMDPENAWYIDWYAKCTVSEDEARTMEYGIHTGSAYYYDSPHIDKKSRFLNAVIREAFPCVKSTQEAVFWEQRTGIVDLYQEFPDFVGVQ